MTTRSILSLTAAIGLALSLSACANSSGIKQMQIDMANATASEPARKVAELNKGVVKAYQDSLPRDASGVAWTGISAQGLAGDNYEAGQAIDKVLDAPMVRTSQDWTNQSTGHRGFARTPSEGTDASGRLCRKLEVSSEVGLKQPVQATLSVCKTNLGTWTVLDITAGNTGSQAGSISGTAASNDAMPRTSSAANVRAAQQYTAGTSSADYSHVAQNVHTALTSPNLRSWPWNEPSTGHTGSVAAVKQYSLNGLLCRDVESKTSLGKKQVQTDRATYCQSGQDTWVRQ